MPLRDELLKPIPGPNPSGANLRYEPLYAQIQEARREEEDAAQGIWQHAVKIADYPLVIKLATVALSTKSKDLQIAGWLTEALVYTQGFAGLEEGLGLIRELLERFWETVYPELEDGDAEMRSVPISWVGSCLDQAIKSAPITVDGHDWLFFKRSRAVPYEEESGYDDAKRKVREEAVNQKRPLPEEFDAAVNATPKAFYQELRDRLARLMAGLQSLDDYCGERFGEVAPSLTGLRRSLEEVSGTVHVLLEKKREAEPDAPSAPAVAPQAPSPAASFEPSPVPESRAPEPQPEPRLEPRPAHPEPQPAHSEPRPSGSGSVPTQPIDRQDAIDRILGACAFLRHEDPGSPVPLLLVRALRWGELRGLAPSLDPMLLEAPPTETRQQLKNLALAGDWQGLLEATETAMGLPYGRGWLDLQRYAARALEGLGAGAATAAIRSELKLILADLPELRDACLLDDTPAANPETQAWLREWLQEVAAPVPPPEASQPMPVCEPEPAPPGETALPDAHTLAVEAARAGRTDEAIQILARRWPQETTGRARFQRKVQLAQLCIDTGHQSVACPILQELAAEIENRRLEQWESLEMVAYPLALLYRCIDRMDHGSDEARRVYARVCRLDAVQALALSG